MKFTRTFTLDEVKMFKDIGGIERVVTTAIDRALGRRKASLDLRTVESRILMVLSKTEPMAVNSIMSAHNAILFMKPISLNYTRSVLSNMLKAGLISRPGHGQYVKGGK